MRTQLNHILGYAELLLDDVPADDASATSALDDIVAAGHRATAAFGEFLQPSTLDRATSLAAVRRALDADPGRRPRGSSARTPSWDSSAAVDLDRIRLAVVRALALADDAHLVDDGPRPPTAGFRPAGTRPP